MFRSIKQIFISTIIFFSTLPGINSLKCVSMNNQECKLRSEIVDVSSNGLIFYPFSIKVNKCNGICNNVSDPYARICVPDDVENLNVKLFNLMTLTNETKHIKWHETCKCICRLERIFCNSKQLWNENK